MAVVHVPSAMRVLTHGAAELRVAGDTVHDVIEAMDLLYPGIGVGLLKDGKLRPGVQVFVDGASERLGLRARVSSETSIHFIPAMTGGVS